MAVAYIPPRVTVREIISPTFNPALIDPNSIVIVGPSQGYQSYTETVLLNDNSWYTLAAQYPDLSTLSIVDATNLTNAPFTVSTTSAEHDYDVDSTTYASTGQVRVRRAMQTTIANGETVVVYFENSGSPAQNTSFTEWHALNGTTTTALTNVNSGTQAASISVQKVGKAPTADYTINNNGQSSVSIVWTNTATVLKQYQTIYVDYTLSGVTYSNVAIQLNALTAVSLPADATVTNVKTASGADLSITASAYALGSTNTLDYIVSGSGGTTAIARSAGTTTIGLAQDKLQVKITYQATPVTYWLPTRCLSLTDVANKYGAAYDSNGNVLNPVTVAASLAFANGATSVIIQALFAAGTPNTQPTGTVSDWENTLANLYTVDTIDVLVPLISTGGLSTNDAQNLQILQAVQSFLNYMSLQQNQPIVAVCGEDSTGGSMASEATLQSHAQSLGVGTPTSVSLLSPAAYQIINPVTGQPSNLGGQYMASAIAGMWGRYSVQTPFTRKLINGFSDVVDLRTEQQKNQDAGYGLLVVENKNGFIRVRHAITVAQDSIAHQELNVVRAKFWMMASIARAFDTQVIGNMVIDANTTFLLQLWTDQILQLLQGQGAIVSYNNIQVQRNPSNPTGVQIQYSYLPAYGLNYIDVSFALDAATGLTFNVGTPTQGQGL